MNESQSITDDQATELSEMFRLMGDPSRLKIIVACLSVPISVSDVAAMTRLSPSLVSHHLRLLRAARILRAERRGKQVFYVSADEHVRCTISDMIAHVREDGDAHVREDGDAHVREDGDAHVREDGDAHVREDGDAHVREDGDAHVREDGDAHEET